jgi:hypothetical protein
VGEIDARGTYLVECYWPSVTESAHAAAAERARAAADETTGAVQFLGSILIPSEETVFCLFSGRREDVRAASARAELPFERILKSIPVQRVAAPSTTSECDEREAAHA